MNTMDNILCLTVHGASLYKFCRVLTLTKQQGPTPDPATLVQGSSKNNRTGSGQWCYLTLKVLVTTIDVQWKGMGDVGSVRYEPALLPPCLTIRVISYSNQYIFRNSAL